MGRDTDKGNCPRPDELGPVAKPEAVPPPKPKPEPAVVKVDEPAK